MKILLATIFLSLFLFFPVASFAQPAPDGRDFSKDKINLGSQQTIGIKAVGNPNANVGAIVSNAILILYIVGGLAVLLFVVWGAFDWITSGGDKEKISNARKKILNAFIGLALLASAYFLVSLFGQIAGYNPLNTPDLPRLDQAPGPVQVPAQTTP